LPTDNTKQPRILFQRDDETIAISMDEFKALIHEAVEEVLDHKCRLPLTTEQIEEIPHMLGMVKDVGNDSLSKGVEEMRKNHQWFTKTRCMGEKIGTGLILLVLGGLVTGAGTVAVLGIKHAIKSVVGGGQ
jgi:hypothetical protein